MKCRRTCCETGDYRRGAESAERTQGFFFAPVLRRLYGEKASQEAYVEYLTLPVPGIGRICILSRPERIACASATLYRRKR